MFYKVKWENYNKTMWEPIFLFLENVVIALVENGGTWWAWSHVTKGSYKTSAIFCHAAIGSLAINALAAFLIFEQAYSTTYPFPFP